MAWLIQKCICTHCTAHLMPGSGPSSVFYTCVQYGSATMLVAKRSIGVTPEVNLRDPLYQAKHDVKGTYGGFETQGRHHQKSKTGILVAPHKGLMSSIIKNKNAY